MGKKSQALQLADALEKDEYPPRRAAAIELRRLHEENERLKALGKERVAHWMMQRGYATGHGDTIEDLLKELEWQIREQEREACADVCVKLAVGGGCAADCAAAIRATGEQ